VRDFSVNELPVPNATVWVPVNERCGSALEVAGTVRDIDGVLPERLEGNDLQGPLVRRGQHHVGRGPVVMGPQPVRGRHAPAVPGHEPGEVELGDRGDQVVADLALVLQELSGDHRADRVAAEVLRPGGAAPVPVEPGHRVAAAWLQLAAEHVAIAHP